MPNRPSETAAAMLRSLPGTLLDPGKDFAPDRFFTNRALTSMNLKRVPQLRPCPSCGGPMLKISTSEIHECKGCRLFVTEPR